MAVIDNIISDKQGIKDQIGDLPQVIPVLKTFNQKIIPKHLVTKLQTREIQSSFIIGHPTQAQRDVTPLALDYGPFETVYVLPQNDVFQEFFVQDDYINTSNTTATLDTVNEAVVFTTSTVFETDIIYKSDKDIVGFKAKSLQEGIFYDSPFRVGVSRIGVDPIGGGNVEMYASNDGGVTWNIVNNAYSRYEFDSLSKQGLKIRFVAQTDFEFTTPLKIEVFT